LTPTVAIWVQLCKEHRVPDRVKPPFVIFDIRALWRSDVKNYKLRLNPVRHTMLIAVSIWQQWASKC